MWNVGKPKASVVGWACLKQQSLGATLLGARVSVQHLHPSTQATLGLTQGHAPAVPSSQTHTHTQHHAFTRPQSTASPPGRTQESSWLTQSRSPATSTEDEMCAELCDSPWLRAGEALVYLLLPPALPGRRARRRGLEEAGRASRGPRLDSHHQLERTPAGSQHGPAVSALASPPQEMQPGRMPYHSISRTGLTLVVTVEGNSYWDKLRHTRSQSFWMENKEKEIQTIR